MSVPATWLLIGVFVLSGCGSDLRPEDPDNGGVVELPPPPPANVDVEPAWSPDGRSIAYTHIENDISRPVEELWLLDVETRQKRFLTWGRRPAWSPDGTRLAYILFRDLHMVSLESGEVTQLTTFGDVVGVEWSPNADEILYVANDRDRDTLGLWIVNVSVLEKRKIFHRGGDPSWSPDGGRIAYSTFADQLLPPAIFVLELATGRETQLSGNEADDRDPDWSPDGTRIAWYASFPTDHLNPKTGTWIMNADGLVPRLTIPKGRNPSWSPDGTRIAFEGLNEGLPDLPDDTYTLWVSRSDGSGAEPWTLP